MDLGQVPEEPAPEPLTPDEEEELKEYLRELRRITATTAHLEKYRKEEIYPRAIALLDRGGSRTLVDPNTGKPIIGMVRRDETLEVSYDKLVELVGEDVANAVCKPRVVDTTEGGLFQQAVDAGVIPLEIVAEVARYKPKSAFVGFANPSGAK